MGCLIIQKGKDLTIKDEEGNNIDMFYRQYFIFICELLKEKKTLDELKIPKGLESPTGNILHRVKTLIKILLKDEADPSKNNESLYTELQEKIQTMLVNKHVIVQKPYYKRFYVSKTVEAFKDIYKNIKKNISSKIRSDRGIIYKLLYTHNAKEQEMQKEFIVIVLKQFSTKKIVYFVLLLSLSNF